MFHYYTCYIKIDPQVVTVETEIKNPNFLFSFTEPDPSFPMPCVTKAGILTLLSPKPNVHCKSNPLKFLAVRKILPELGIPAPNSISRMILSVYSLGVRIRLAFWAGRILPLINRLLTLVEKSHLKDLLFLNYLLPCLSPY